jgi:hypothetical protein
VLILLPVLLVLAAAGVWAWQTFGKNAEPVLGPAPPEVRVRIDTRAGVKFEVEYLVGAVDEGTGFGEDEAIRYTRGANDLDYDDGRLVLSGIEFPSPRPGDLVRWNRDGSLLINGVMQQPLPRFACLPLTFADIPRKSTYFVPFTAPTFSP